MWITHPCNEQISAIIEPYKKNLIYMQKEKATERVRIYPSSHSNIRVKAARAGKGTSMADIVKLQDEFYDTNIGKYPIKGDKKKTFALLEKASRQPKTALQS